MKKIDAVWMFVAIDEDGYERKLSSMVNGLLYPLMTTNKTILDPLKKLAQENIRKGDVELRLLKFTNGELVETIKPEIDDGNH